MLTGDGGFQAYTLQLRRAHGRHPETGGQMILRLHGARRQGFDALERLDLLRRLLRSAIRIARNAGKKLAGGSAANLFFFSSTGTRAPASNVFSICYSPFRSEYFQHKSEPETCYRRETRV